MELFMMNQSLNSASLDNDSSIKFVDDQDALEKINQLKARLLMPVIMYTILLMLVGTVGNSLSIYIYGWKWANTTTRVFLFCLAVIELLNCLITMPTEVYAMTHYYYFQYGGFCRISRFLTYANNNASAAIFVGIAIDRYIRICHLHRNNLSVTQAQMICGLSICVGIGVSWPALVLYGSKTVYLPRGNKNDELIRGCICGVKNEWDKTPYPVAFFIYLWCAFLVCTLVVSVIYILIGRVVLKRKMFRRGHDVEPKVTNLSENEISNTMQTDEEVSEVTKSAAEQNSHDVKCGVLACPWKKSKMRRANSTMMLFAITAVFVVSFLPFLIISMIRQHVGPQFYPSLSQTEQVLVNLFSRSYLVNNCSNPIVYGLCITQFREQVYKIFRRDVKKLTKQNNISTDESSKSRRLSETSV